MAIRAPSELTTLNISYSSTSIHKNQTCLNYCCLKVSKFILTTCQPDPGCDWFAQIIWICQQLPALNHPSRVMLAFHFFLNVNAAIYCIWWTQFSKCVTCVYTVCTPTLFTIITCQLIRTLALIYGAGKCLVQHWLTDSHAHFQNIWLILGKFSKRVESGCNHLWQKWIFGVNVL